MNHTNALRQSPKGTEIKGKINKWDLIKLKSFCTAKEIINRMKRQLSEWENILANKATDKGLISKILQTVCAAYGEGNGNPLQYSCLENSMDGGAWWAAVYGVTQNWMQLTGLNFKNIQQLIQLDNNNIKKQPNQKMGRRPKQILLQRRHKDGQ